MASSWEPGEEGINPSYEKSLAEFDPAARAAANKENDAVDNLRNAENSALASNGAESWKNNVNGPGGLGSKQGKNSKGKGFGKKKGSIVALITAMSITLGGATFLGSSHSMLGPAMSAILTGKSDYRYTATYSQWTNNKFMKAIMKKATGTKNKPVELSDDFIANLKTYGIDVDNSGNNYTFKYDGKTITGDNFSDAFDNDANFRTAFTNAKQNRAANFFDPSATTTYGHYNISRNTLKDFQDTDDVKADTDNYNKTQSAKYENQVSDVTTTHPEEKETEIEENGQKKKVTTVENERNETASSKSETNTDLEAAKTKASSFIGKIGSVTRALNWGCTVLRTGNMVIKTASAMQRITSILYFMGMMESVSKMMAGEGNQAGYNVLMNFLSSSSTTTIEDYTNASASVSQSGGDSGSVSISIGEETKTGAPIQSNLTNVLSYSPLDKKLAKNFSFDSMAMLFTGAFGFTTMKAAGCAISNISESVASLAINLIPGGGGIKLVGGMLFKAIFVGITAISVGSLLGFLIPHLAKSLFMNKFLSLSGIPAGEEGLRGALAANGKLAQNSGLGFGTMADAAEFQQITNTVLAMEAESDRINRSPFDITSRNTFLGSIAYNLLAVSLSSNSFSALNALAGSTSRSIASLTSSAYADDGITVDAGTDLVNRDEDCSFSHLVDGQVVAGSAWCTTLAVTNANTLNIDPTDPDFVATIDAELECNGDECNVKKDGDLAKTISYCFQRDTEPDETPDARILAEMHTPTILSTASMIFPPANDVVNILDGFSDLANVGWATGETCFTHPNMDKYKAYAIQETLYEQTMAGSGNGIGYVSPITKYVAEYDAEHPINNMTDLVARHAGLTTTDAEFMIALAEYADFLEDYDPTTRIALGPEVETVDPETPLARLVNNTSDTSDRIEYSGVVAVLGDFRKYGDVRNRSYAI